SVGTWGGAVPFWVVYATGPGQHSPQVPLSNIFYILS
ncbi:unnamed protein product, partial [marine sediment metagenome]